MQTSATTERSDFYVYIMFRLDKPKGEYIYGEGKNQVKFDYEPFYVGRGKGDRCYNHFRVYDLNNDRNIFKSKIIKKLINLNFRFDAIVSKISENLLGDLSNKIEKRLIKTIGRRDKGFGPLSNLTDGGEGTCGNIPKNRKTKLYIIDKIKVLWSNLFDSTKIEIEYQNKYSWNTYIKNIFCNKHKNYFDSNYKSIILEKKNSCPFCKKEKRSEIAKNRTYIKGYKHTKQAKHNMSISQLKVEVRENKRIKSRKFIFKIINNKNETFIIDNFREFCEKYNLHKAHLYETFTNPKRRNHTKGFKIIERTVI